MKKPVILLLLLLSGLLLPAVSFAQMRDVEFSRVKEPASNSVSINAVKHAPGSFYIEVYLSDLENTMTPAGTVAKTIKSPQTIVTLAPVNGNEPVRFRFTTRFIRINADPKPELDFVYRLPCESGSTVRADSLRLLNSAGHKNNANWYAYTFRMEKDAPVYAIRKGIVLEVTEAKEEEIAEEGSGRITFKDNVTQLLIEHEDGTYARYSVLAPGSVTVKEGDTVFPNTVLGLAGTYDNKHYQCRLLIYYHQKIRTGTFHNGPEFIRHYVEPVVLTEKGAVRLTPRIVYTGQVTPELITKEMSKREKKQLSK